MHVVAVYLRGFGEKCFMRAARDLHGMIFPKTSLYRGLATKLNEKNVDVLSQKRIQKIDPSKVMTFLRGAEKVGNCYPKWSLIFHFIHKKRPCLQELCFSASSDQRLIEGTTGFSHVAELTNFPLKVFHRGTEGWDFFVVACSIVEIYVHVHVDADASKDEDVDEGVNIDPIAPSTTNLYFRPPAGGC